MATLTEYLIANGRLNKTNKNVSPAPNYVLVCGSHGIAKYHTAPGFVHLFLIIVVLLAGIVLIGYFVIKNGQIKVNNNNLAVSSPTPTPQINETEDLPRDEVLRDWKTYMNEKYKYTVGYPSDFTTREVVHTEAEDPLHTVFIENNNDLNSRIFLSTYKKQDNYSLASNIKQESLGHITDRIENESVVTIKSKHGTRLDYYVFTGENRTLQSTFITSSTNFTYSITSKSNVLNQTLPTFRFID